MVTKEVTIIIRYNLQNPSVCFFFIAKIKNRLPTKTLGRINTNPSQTLQKNKRGGNNSNLIL